MFFSHGSEHSRGVLILIKNSLEFELISVRADKEERFIFLEAFVQDQKFLFVNIYAPNKLSVQTLFFDQIKDELDNSGIDEDCRIIMGGFALINDIEYGGLKVMDLESIIRAQRIMCLKKYIDDYTSPWKSFLRNYLEKVGGKFIFQCHFDCRNLPIFMPGFYKDCLDAWSSLTRQEVYSYEDIMNQVVWNNRYILSEGKSLHYVFITYEG